MEFSSIALFVRSGGTATCSGVYQNVSSAFGDAINNQGHCSVNGSNDKSRK